MKADTRKIYVYDESCLKRVSPAISLDPELLPFPGRQYPSGKTMFGVFADASPDRWGRVLMNKRERIKAEKESRKPKKLYDSDYLIGVYDETRMGGLRFKECPDGPFLSDDRDAAVPPWARLRTLEEVARNYEKSLNVDETDNRIRIELAISVAERFGITKTDAKEIACDIQKKVNDHWRYLAGSYGLSRGQIKAMSPAFMIND